MNEQPDKPRQAWHARAICCGRDDGAYDFATRGDAEVFRSQYTAGAGIAGPGMPAGHDRSVIITGQIAQGLGIGRERARALGEDVGVFERLTGAPGDGEQDRHDGPERHAGGAEGVSATNKALLNAEGFTDALATARRALDGE